MLSLAFLLLVQAQQPQLIGAPPASAPTAQSQNPAAPADTSGNNLPVSLDRIQRALEGPPPIKLQEAHPVFRVEVFGKKPTLEDLLGEKFWVGNTPYGGMTHQEFMQMNTPKELQPYAGFTGKYLAAEAALRHSRQRLAPERRHAGGVPESLLGSRSPDDRRRRRE